MNRQDCETCRNCIDKLLLQYRRVTFVRLGDRKVVMQLVSDVDPNAVKSLEDDSAEGCRCRVEK